MITITRSNETIASCNSCDRANYNSEFGTKKEVDELFDLDVGRPRGNMTSRTKLCKDCLMDLEEIIGRTTRRLG
jgi:hypothetical protein